VKVNPPQRVPGEHEEEGPSCGGKRAKANFPQKEEHKEPQEEKPQEKIEVLGKGRRPEMQRELEGIKSARVRVGRQWHP
jgi:hypothetical protein